MTGEKPTCATCPFWYEMFDNGQCRRYAPRAYTFDSAKLEGESNPEVVFPETLEEHWCGEHPDFADRIAARRRVAPEEARS